DAAWATSALTASQSWNLMNSDDQSQSIRLGGAFNRCLAVMSIGIPRGLAHGYNKCKPCKRAQESETAVVSWERSPRLSDRLQLGAKRGRLGLRTELVCLFQISADFIVESFLIFVVVRESSVDLCHRKVRMLKVHF